MMLSRTADDLAKENYKDYAIYVNETRAFASIEDGLKSVQRRIIYACNKFSSIEKSAELEGAVMSLHPHGSSYGAIVNMASPVNNLPMFDIQGNFGGYNCGASASRYTGACLSKIARFIFCQFIDYAEIISGEIGKPEPKALPCLIPYSFINGLNGIGVGMKPDILPFDLMDLIDYYIYYIENGTFRKNKPLIDKGSVIIECDRDEYNSIVKEYKGSIPVKSVIKQEAENIFVVESLPGINIEKIVSDGRKLGKYIDSDQVIYRNETKSEERYVFEVEDRSCIDKFVKDLERSVSKRHSFNSGYVHNGCTVFCDIDHVIKEQFKLLNIAIDKKIDTEYKRALKRSEFLIALSYFNDNGYLDNLREITRESLISSMMNAKDDLKSEYDINLTEELCKTVVSKPITIQSLTNTDGEDSIKRELKHLKEELDKLRNHNRKQYLIDLYEELRNMIKPVYESKNHSILKTEVISNPRARLGGPIRQNQLEIVGKGRGVRFKEFLVLIGENGGLYKHNISVVRNCIIDIPYDEKIVGVVGDNCRYVELIANDGTGVTFDMNNYQYNKRVANLVDSQLIVEAVGYEESNVPKDVKDRVRTRICKTMRR